MGHKNLNLNNNIFICIGQCTGNVGNVYDKTGISAYNGGGTGSSSGGGATHIASTDRGELKNYASYKTEVYIVAGGGGAGADSQIGTGSGGSGGGTAGGNGVSNSSLSVMATGGSQTSAGVNGKWGNSATTVVNTPGFGQGGGCHAESNNYGGGGGGGWYGGGGNPVGGSGAGGSGYIDGVSNGSMQNGVRTGHGYAVITWHPAI